MSAMNTQFKLSQQKGFSLIELMVSLAIGLFLMASVLMIVVSATQSTRVSDAETEMNEEGVIALSLLQQQIRLAGYSQTVADTDAINKNFVGTSIRGCDKGFADAGVAFTSLTCNTAGDNNSAIAIRYEADKINTTEISSKASNCQMNGITADSTSAVAAKPDFALADNRYYVRSSGTDSGRPELSCRGATSKSTYDAVQPLIENVEQLKFTYGVVATSDPADNQIVTYMTATEIDDNYAAKPLVERWSRVASIKICLVMRSAETARDNSVSGQVYKDCDGASQTSTDGYLRRAYISTAQLRNKASVPLEKL